MNNVLDLLTLELGGRVYGASLAHDKGLSRSTERVELDPAGMVFLQDVYDTSQILRLLDGATLDDVVQAYTADLASLSLRKREIVGVFGEICRSQFRVQDSSPSALDDTLTNLKLTVFEDQFCLRIQLTADRCASTDLSIWIKKEFEAELVRMSVLVGDMMQRLVHLNLVGLITYAPDDPQICQFYYFTKEAISEIAETKRVLPRSGPDRVIETTRTETRIIRQTRSTHHLVKAGVHRAEDYKEAVPNRIHRFFGSIPPWLMNSLIVVDGTEVLCESVTFVTADVVERRSLSVVRYDPAVVIGPFVLAGWGPEDVKLDRIPTWFTRLRSKIPDTVSEVVGIILTLIFTCLIAYVFIKGVFAIWTQIFG